ncbi:hypothetical protein BCR41DRAFT_103509 [Lobosporangium transversale]|uniref:Uncharacterized protein n=1 Tax=Lobosporangium transversale TaxID=64571 RepID=A0A1Y2GIR2_9FUNG|nr:hypothetical protein BCR41DRAFT_103509 [Lobosporangium transversale]ORZ12041.1 hypothetical protein BCR41DRAFT_103509 [Lobosporangium transversale]|eukprot:XP_021879906.1 hypothetical protein BCR41DRAFT_103509 [Lobosporangium transversale]
MNPSTLSPISLRSPQQPKPHSISSAYSSDELPNIVPQRPPRSDRQRADSTSSPTISGAQYYQYYYSQRQQQQYEQYMSSSPPSSRPSPRSTPNSYAMSYPSQPSSPMSFQLPPSALSPAKDDMPRSGSISHQPSRANSTLGIQIPQLQASSSLVSPSYRTPRMSPGLSSASGSASDSVVGGSSTSSGGAGVGAGVGELSVSTLSTMPPLALPGSFLEEQSDYAEYYSDVGIISQQQEDLQQRQFRQHYQNALLSIPISPHQTIHRQQPTVAEYSPQHLNVSMFLPSPMMSPTTPPFTGDFSALSLDDSASNRLSVAPHPLTEDTQAYPEGYYQGRPHIPIESFLMPTQEQYPPDRDWKVFCSLAAPQSRQWKHEG